MNPFAAYVRYLCDLHILAMQGLHNGPDAVRERMDEPWQALSGEDRELIVLLVKLWPMPDALLTTDGKAGI